MQERGQVVLEEQKERLSSAIETGKKAVSAKKEESPSNGEEASAA